MTPTRGAIVFLSLMLLALGLAVPAVGMSPSSSGVHQGNVAFAHALAPVYIHFKSKHLTGQQGGTVSGSAIVKDSGSYAFTATSCQLWYRTGTSGAWTKSGSCLSPSVFPHTFNAHSKTKFSGSQKVSSTFPTGTYEWKFALIGTYNGVTEESHSGVLTVTIT
jgi:hypothetical protein